MLHCLGLFYEAAWWLDCHVTLSELFYEAAWWLDYDVTLSEFVLWSCLMIRLKLLCVVLLFAYDILVLQSCSNAGPVGIATKKIKMFFVLCFRCSVVALIIWDLSWHLPNYSVHISYFVFHVNEVQKAGWEFLCEWVIVNYISHSLWKWKLFSNENLNSLWRIR